MANFEAFHRTKKLISNLKPLFSEECDEDPNFADLINTLHLITRI